MNGMWTADGSNQYHTDDIGDTEWIVIYYRNHPLPPTAPAAPCQWEIDQKMQINQVGGKWVTYKTNRLKFGIDLTRVWSYRDGQNVSTDY